METISFHFHETKPFEFFNQDNFKKWIEKVVKQLSDKELGVVEFVFCTDEYLLKINQKFLNHDTLTDIITFNYNIKLVLQGEIYISLERVTDNSKQLKTSFEEEIKRVIIHGVLHLIGFDDKSSSDKQLMREKEDYCLNLWSEI